MSTRRTMQIQGGILLSLALFLLNAGCPNTSLPSRMKSPPNFDGETQDVTVSVDDSSDGNIDASDPQVPTNVSPPAQLAQAASNGHTVTLELDADFDTILLICRHELTLPDVTTVCSGDAHGSFDIAVNGDAAEFTLAIYTTPATLPLSVNAVVIADVFIDCGNGPSGPHVLASPFGPLQRIAEIPVDPSADECAVTIDLTLAQVVSEESFFDVTVVQAVTVTARDVAFIECNHSSECPDHARFCNPDGACQAGITAEPCTNVGVHCDAEHQLTCNEGCSRGHAGSNCRGDFECLIANQCVVGACQGPACTSDADCPGDAPNCTEDGCTAEGEHHHGCFRGFSCKEGLCLNNVCNHIAGEGEACTEPDTVCAAGTHCVNASGTCERPLDLGETCVENAQCAIFFGESCIGGVCAPKSNTGGECDPDDHEDCLGVRQCTGANTCS